MKRLIFLAPIAFFGLLIAAFAAGLGRDPTTLPSTLIDKPLPAFDLPAVRPGDVGLKSSDGAGQPHLLNVFASWCVSCRIEHPVLLQLKAQGVPIDGRLDWKRTNPSTGRSTLSTRAIPTAWPAMTRPAAPVSTWVSPAYRKPSSSMATAVYATRSSGRSRRRIGPER